MEKSSIAYALYVVVEKCVHYSYDAFEEMDSFEYMGQTFTGKPLPPDWKLPKHTAEYTKFPQNDFVPGFWHAPFVSKRVKEVLEPILGKESEFRPIGKVLGKDYYIMNATNVVDCLDKKKSAISYSPSDGRIMGINKAVFLSHRMPNAYLFKVPEDMSLIYATDRFVEAVRRYKLTGVSFEPSNHRGVTLRNDVFPDLPLLATKSRRSR